MSQEGGLSRWVPSTTKNDFDHGPSANDTLNELSIDPYPFGIDEVFDAYRIIVESKGRAIGMARLTPGNCLFT